MLNLDGTEYDIESMSDEQKAMTNHIADLSRKIDSMQFNMQQLQFGKECVRQCSKRIFREKGRGSIGFLFYQGRQCQSNG